MSNRKTVALILATAAISLLIGCSQQPEQTKQAELQVALTGPYLGQPLPGDEPVPFAQGIVNIGMYVRDVAMMPDGSEIYWGAFVGGKYAIIVSKMNVDGTWTEPEVTSFSSTPGQMDIEPFINSEGSKFYFLSGRPVEEGGEEGQNIWVMDRIDNDWGVPYLVPAPVGSELAEFFPSLTRDGTIYFSRTDETRVNKIYRSRLIDGEYEDVELLGPEVNCGTNRFNAFIDPDERYVIVPAVGMADSVGGVDYYVVFRNEDDQWSAPVNMGEMINSSVGNEYSPYISPDGKYFFFMASRPAKFEEVTFEAMKAAAFSPTNGQSAIWWVKADFIEDLRPEGW